MTINNFSYDYYLWNGSATHRTSNIIIINHNNKSKRWREMDPTAFRNELVPDTCFVWFLDYLFLINSTYIIYVHHTYVYYITYALHCGNFLDVFHFWRDWLGSTYFQLKTMARGLIVENANHLLTSRLVDLFNFDKKPLSFEITVMYVFGLRWVGICLTCWMPCRDGTVITWTFMFRLYIAKGA